jgi:hypothetical protein
MIDHEIFLQYMALLADRIGRPLAGPTQLMYHRELSAALSTEQFVAAATIAFNRWNAEFRTWPSPQQLIAMVMPSPETALSALEAFEQVLSATTDSRVPLPDAVATVETIGPAAARAFRAAGGIREFRGVLEQDLPWLRRRFVEAYEAAAEAIVNDRTAAHALTAANETVASLIADLSRPRQMPGARRLGA